ncbi:MAG: diguanylate cyclase [Chromatiales bacterium]|nr:diguanylate cyclase [Chromatiales bacterium]
MTRRSLLFRFLALTLPLLLLLGFLHYWDLDGERERWRLQLATDVEQSAASLANGFHEAAADALALAADVEFRDRLPSGDFAGMASRMEALARFKSHYRQLRYLDETGMERLRVDTTPTGNVVRIPAHELQDKSGRDYFAEARHLPEGAVRLSRLDLNIEHGQIETPHNPMLRFSSPVFDATGVRRGMIVINLGAGPLLDRLHARTHGQVRRLALINAKGSWLAGADAELRWGDVLGNGNGFASERPQAWRRLVQEVHEAPTQWQSDGYLYARATLYPVDILRSRMAHDETRIESADPWWIVIGEADLRAVDAAPRARLQTGLTIAGSALVLWFFILRGWRRLNLAARESGRRIRQLASVVEQTSDIVFITDPEGRIEYVNPAFTHTTGYAAEDVAGKTPAILKSGQHPPAFFSALWDDIKQGRQFRDLFINRRRDGTLFYEEKTILPLVGDNGRISSFVSTGKDITDSKVTKLAFHDQLTGLVNRPLFMDRLQHEMAHAARGGECMAVLYMDLDGFKAVNDSMGHRAGDEILREFARRIGALMRKSDTLARLGGDEFAMLLRDIDTVADAEQAAAKIIAAMQSGWIAGDSPARLGISIGIALYPGDNVDIDGEALIACADAAMYDAKRGGRNRYVVYTPTTDAMAD